MNPQELARLRAAALTSAMAIKDGAEASGEPLTDAQHAKITEYMDTANDLKGQIADAEAHAATLTTLAAEHAALTEQPAPVAPLAPGAASPAAGASTIVVHDDPMHGFRSHTDFLMSVRAAGCGGGVENRLEPWMVTATAGSDEQAGYANPVGRFLIPETVAPGMLQTAAPDDPVSALVTRVPMTTPTIKFNARVDKVHSTSVSGGLRVYRRAEADAVASSTMTFEQVKLEATSLMGVAYTTNEILDDSPVSFAALLAQGFGIEMASKLIKERLTGTGVGQFLGVNNSDALIQVTKESGQVADTVVFQNVLKIRSRMWNYGNAVWFANQTLLPQLSTMTMDVGTGGVPVWLPAGAVGDHPDMLLGRPLIFTEYMSALGDANDIGCYDFSQYLEGTLKPLEAASSIHVRFLQNETAFKFTMRNDARPWWTSALTPENGDTLSPFVTLGERA